MYFYLNCLLGKLFRGLNNNSGYALEKHRFVLRSRYVRSGYSTSMGRNSGFLGISTIKTKFLYNDFEIQIYVFCFYGRHLTVSAATPCTCRWSTVTTTKDRCYPGPWTGPCRLRCGCCTPSCRPTGSAWPRWRRCSTCGPTRRLWPACYWCPNPWACCRPWPLPVTECPSSGCRPCSALTG